MLYTKTVVPGTLALIQKLMSVEPLGDFVLAGGTALALTLGHRQSVDIDLFSQKGFDAESLATCLKDQFNADVARVIKNGVFCAVDGVKLDLVTHAYPYMEMPKIEERIRFMPLSDIAAMKLHAIVNSGQRAKDYVDIYALLEQMSLSQMHDAYEKKYAPNTHRSIANAGLKLNQCLSQGGDIVLLKEEYDSIRIANRLRSAIEYPDKVFGPYKMVKSNNNKLEVKQNVPRKRKGPRL